jgi:uncharacterized iron-regulated protein
MLTKMTSTGLFRRLFQACAFTALLASCGSNPLASHEHPLVGSIWDVGTKHQIDPETLAERATGARFVLLGEIHDNKAQHQIQMRLLERLVRGGKRPALVMEQYDRDQQKNIDDILASDADFAVKVQGLGALMGKGWEWPSYEPLVRFAVTEHLPIVAANLSRTEVRQVSRNGFPALGEGEEQRLALDKVWTPERDELLLHDIFEGHCRKVPEHVVVAIAKAQRARDAVMADMLLRHRERGAIGIMGNGHVRLDMAVPLYLAARAPDLRVLSLGLVQVDETDNPMAYARSPVGQVFDYVWFTERAKRATNPCDDIAAPKTLGPV